MKRGKLILCLSMIEGETSQRRCIEEGLALASFNMNGLLFIGFSKNFQNHIQSSIPKECYDNFLDENIKQSEFFDHLIKSSIKIVVFNHLIDRNLKTDRIKFIIQLLNAGIDVVTHECLEFFELAQHDLKNIPVFVPPKGPLVPTSFLKYISRVIMVRNFHDTMIDPVESSIEMLLKISSKKNIQEKLASIAFVLATHINYQHNQFNLYDERSPPYTQIFPKKLNFLSKIAIGFNGFITYYFQKIKQTAFNTTVAVMNFMTVFMSLSFVQFNVHIKERIFVLIFLTIFVINLLTYSFRIAFVSLLFSILFIYYFIGFGYTIIPSPLNQLALILSFLCVYVILYNHRRTFYQKEQFDKKNSEFNELYIYAKNLTAAANFNEIFHIAQTYFSTVCHLDIMFILQNPYTLKTEQIITKTSTSLIEEDVNEFTLKQEIIETYNAYEFIPLTSDSLELGWIGLKSLTEDMNNLNRSAVDSGILQLIIALHRYNLSKSYNDAVLHTEKEQLRSIILSSISHDLKTPLTTIIGSCTALEEIESLSEKNKMILVRTIHEASEQLNQFISDILDNYRLATENILEQKSLIYLDDVINVVLQRAKKIIRLFDVKVSVSSPEESAIYCDFTLIQQVFYNLIENATKYSPIGSTISIVINNFMDKVFVRIYDNGPGIIESKRHLIFDKFYRFQHADQQKAGTGLGLSICKQIIEAYKGRIWVSDRDDDLKGAQFNIELPCAFPKHSLQKNN